MKPDPEVVQGAIEKVLASRTFRSAKGQRNFLRYAVTEVMAGRADQLKEYAIGMEALARGPSFDPRLDPIVRTQARKLRARLSTYYETEGATDLVRIEFPKGSYVPLFKAAETACCVPDEVSIESCGQPEAQLPVASVIAVPTPGVFRLGWRSAVLGLVAVAAFAVSPLLYSNWRSHVLASNSTSIAVMPFVNVDDKNGDEFLSDGLTDELIGSLQQMPGLHVIARTSAFRFKGTTLDVREIGRKLKVSTVLDGSVRKSGNRLLITVQLNATADGYHLWSGNYDRDASDARAVQSEISQAVANVLGVRLGGRGGADLRQALPNLASPNPGAYQDYLKGLYFWNKLTADGLKTAIHYFQQAIEEDPSFARVYTALADCYVLAPQVAAFPPSQVVPRIREAASRALELDSSLGEAHFDLAICAEYDFDWAGAEKEYKKGLELSPGSAVGHLWYAKYLGLTGRRDEVLVQRRIAVELDPVSPYVIQSIAGYHSVMGRYDDAIEEFRSALAMEPNFGLTHQGLGVAYLLKGRKTEGIAELQTACKLMDGPRRMALLGWAYGVSGNSQEARRILDQFLQQSQREPFPALAIAEVYIGLGDKDRAFEWLARAIDQRDLNLDLLWDSFYQPLRSDSRFAALLRRQKLS
jgi:TolB-like protein